MKVGLEMSILKQVKKSPGFALGISFSQDEVTRIKAIIKDHLVARARVIDPTQASRYEVCDLENYHSISSSIPHSKLITRTDRILPESAVQEIRSMRLFRQLESEVGYFEISDEEGVGRENVLMRLVRPGEESDVGSLHCDDWFWQLYKFPLPAGRKRVKVWVAICCEPGKGGLLVSPDSHKRQWKYGVTHKSGMAKPLLDASENPALELVSSRPGDGVVFNYELLHGGAVTSGTQTRVSLEFTMLIPEGRYDS
jgi:hypothetical protein